MVLEAAAGEDRSTRARIRDAALMEFAEHGFRGASIRGIAKQAGVSPGLVQHHYGSKEALLEACDAHVLEVIRRLETEAVGQLADPAFLTRATGTMGPVLRYLSRAMSSDSPAAASRFDEYVAVHKHALTTGAFGPPVCEDDDVDAIAVFMTALQLGVSMMYDHVVRALRLEPDSPELALRIGRAKLYLFNERILGGAAAAQLREGLDRYERQLTSRRRRQGARR